MGQVFAVGNVEQKEWAVIGEDGAARSFVKRPEQASLFETEELAEAARELALEKALLAYRAQYKPGETALPVKRYGMAPDPRQSGPKALRLHKLERTQVAYLEAPKPLEERLLLPSLWVFVCERGSFARVGQTGWLVFTERLAQASLFGSEAEAQEFWSAASVSASKEARPFLAGTRLARVDLAIGASLDPQTLAPSMNAATGSMISMKERVELGAAAPLAAAAQRPRGAL